MKKLTTILMLSTLLLAKQTTAGEEKVADTTPAVTQQDANIQHQDSVELAWVDEQIEAIKPPRKGIKESKIKLLKDPFIFLEKNKTKKKKDARSRRYVAIPTHTIIPSSMRRSSSNSTKKRVQHVVRSSKMKLKAIMNDTALIDGKWYKVGDEVRGYKIAKITLTDVVLKRGKIERTLTTKSNITNRMHK